jgi:hypothetical protein
MDLVEFYRLLSGLPSRCIYQEVVSARRNRSKEENEKTKNKIRQYALAAKAAKEAKGAKE